MNDVVLATTREDAEAAEAVERHHAEMAGALALLVEEVRRASSAADPSEATVARERLVAWLERELVPHALAEEKAMYPAAQNLPEGRLLITGMLAEHGVITDLVRQLAGADPVAAAATATALKVMFDSHLAKENELVLPLLVATPEVSVASLLAGMHEVLGGHSDAPSSSAEAGGCGGHSCGCGEVDGPGYPELDARSVPHAIRHATIFGALDAVPAGGGLILVAPHDPLPLLAQVEERFAGAFKTSYLERGPEAWRLVFERS